MKGETNPSFGSELRALRRGHRDGVSLADIADAIDCSVTYISAIERGERNPPSNSKIAAILEFLGKEGEYERMVGLAVQARKSVEIPVDGTSSQWTHVLLGLARRSEQGMKDDDPFVEELSKLLQKDAQDQEEEKKCLPLFHKSQQKENGKSKRKPKPS